MCERVLIAHPWGEWVTQPERLKRLQQEIWAQRAPRLLLLTYFHFREDQKRLNRWYRKILQGETCSMFHLGRSFLLNFRAEIYYQTMNVVTIRQDPKYTVGWAKILEQLTLLSVQLQSLFGALGGGLSLYLGCAVVMLFEVIELLIDLTFAFICRSTDGKVWDKTIIWMPSSS